ncbi:uncharacterized protein [Typha angustifolia]|uniref:uncharacterized protein n=1 Tax=Typha angustifolia TaxID=59011 RepID=UPI003C2C210F
MDLETLVCGGCGDGKVACETLIGEAPAAAAVPDPDLPAESVQLVIGEDIDWTDVNAVYDRDDSTKGNTNPKSHQQHGNPQMRSNSQRFSGNLKPKAPIIGLPGKIQHSGYLGRSGRRPASVRIFPKKAKTGEGGRKSAVPESEPSSPKVSCIGKVLSERERGQCRRRRRSPETEEEKDEEPSGCWASMVAFFRCGGRDRGAAAVDSVEESSPSPRSGNTPAKEAAVVAAAALAPGLGGMKRFTSGRRSASWGGDSDDDDDAHVAKREALDPEGVLGRRSVGSLEEAQRERDWESEGPASI